MPTDDDQRRLPRTERGSRSRGDGATDAFAHVIEELTEDSDPSSRMEAAAGTFVPDDSVHGMKVNLPLLARRPSYIAQVILIAFTR